MMDRLDILVKAFGEYQKIGREYMFRCPNGCHETKNKLSVNLDKNAYKCWKCEDVRGGDLRFLILKFAKQYIKEWSLLDLLPVEYGGLVDVEVEQKWFFSDWKKWNKFLYLEWDQQSQVVKDYLESKKITPKQALLWNIRVNQFEKDTLLIPSFGIDGNVTYFSKRKFFGENKFFKPRAPFDIFNEFWLDFSNPIYLVENAFDAVRFSTSEVMPILGSELRRYNSFIDKCIQNETQVNVFLDCDAKDKEYKIYENLLGFGINTQRINNIFDKDIDKLEDWQLQVCKKTFIKASDVLSNYVRGKLL